MKHVGKIHSRPNPIMQTLIGRLFLLSLALLVASCDSSGGGNAPIQPEAPLGSDASLASLSISAATLDPVFSSSVVDYTAAVGFAAKNTQVTAVPEDANATISVNGAAVASGAASDLIPLDEGNNTITVNVIAEDGNTAQTYTVAVARQSASAFTQTAYVKASDARFEDRFGARVALSADGETLSVVKVGRNNGFPNLGVACNEDPFVFGNPKGVYELTRDSDGVWTQHPFVMNVSSPFHFGADLAMSADGSTLAVSVSDAGRVDVFTRDSVVVWLREESIFATNWLLDDESGIRVALSADGATLAVGTVLGVDVLTRDDAGGWAQQTYLQAMGASFGDGFSDIALSADGVILAVGSGGTFSDRTDLRVFARDSEDVWSEEFHSSSGSSSSRMALSADGSTLAVGSKVLARDGDGGWSVQAESVGPGGGSVALSADGAMLALGSGAVYVFTRDSGDAWTQRANIKASNTDVGDAFGFDVDLSADGTVLAVGAPSEASAATGINGDGTDNSLACSGAVYIFEL